MLRLLWVAAIAATAGGSPSADSSENDERSDYEATVHGYRDDDGLGGQRRLDDKTPGFGTAVELDHETGARPADALPEVISHVPGATVRSIGGLGQYSAVSLRGSSSQQVAVFIDGVPLGTSVGGLVDLSDVPVDLLSRVEVFRGYVPIAFGSAAIGGAINLVGHGKARNGDELLAALGAGSYGGRDLRVASRLELGRRDRLALRFGYATAEGDFDFLDVNGTPNLPDRHTMSTRTNNGYARLAGQIAYQGHGDRWRWRLQEILLSKQQGIPGTAHLQSTRTTLDTLAAQTIANIRRNSFVAPGGSLELVSGFGFERRTFRDPLGEVGLAIDDEQSEITDAYLSFRMRLPLWTGAFSSLVANARHEWTGVDNRVRIDPQGDQTTGDASRQRLSLGTGIELQQFLFAGRLMIAPALRWDRAQSFFRQAKGEGEFADAGKDFVHLAFTPRIGIRAQLLDTIQLRGSCGRYFRPPNMLELFGDRGFIVGNEGLVSEDGFSADAGFVADLGSGQPFGLYAQAVGFFSKTANLIQWQQAGPVLRSENVDGATIAGAEVSFSTWLWHNRLRAQANYTFLFTRNDSRSAHTTGKQLPGRPTHEAYSRLSSGYPFSVFGTTIEPRFFYSYEFIAGNYLDPSGRRLVPARALHGTGVETALNDWLRVSFEVRNLLDRRVTTWSPVAANTGDLRVPLSDFIGYPLPGRSYWLSLSAKLDRAPDESHD